MCHRRLFNGRTLIGFPGHRKKPHQGRRMHGMCATARMDTHIDAHVHACELANLNKCVCAHTSMRTPTRYLPVGLFYHIIMAGRGSLALCCSPKAACNVSRERK